MDISYYKLHCPRNKGFTLLEVIIAVSVASVLIFVATDLLLNVMNSPELQLSSMSTIDQARFVGANFTNEIRAAAYGTFPLVQAENSQITFYSPVGAVASQINKIRYYTTGTTLYKGVIAPVNGVYDPGSEVLSAVLTDLVNGADPLFYYYDGDYNGSGTGVPLTQPVNVNDVKFVEINLELAPFSLKTGGAIRILKDNINE